MKKLSILLIGLLLVTGFAFAQEVTVSGSATIEFGVNLDTEMVGFNNSAEADINLVWLSGSEESGTQGWIKLSDWDITFDDDDGLEIDDPDVEAGWMFEPVTITIYSAPGMSIGNADGFLWIYDEEAGEEDDFDVVAPALANKNISAAAVAPALTGDYVLVLVPTGDPAPADSALIGTDGTSDFYLVPELDAGTAAASTSFYGLTADVDLGVATLTLKVASDGTYDNSDNDFAIGAEVSAAIDPVNVVAGVYAGPFDSMDIGFSLGADGTFGPVSVDVGFDGFMADGVDDLDLDVSVDLGVDVSGISLSSCTYIWIAGGLDPDMDQEVVLDASGVVEGLGFTETFQLVNLLSATEPMWWSKTEVSYSTGGIKPYAAFEIDYLSVIDLTVGVELTGFVENTVFTIEYDVDDIENSNGSIIASAKISF
jgi:hypothetical protein